MELEALMIQLSIVCALPFAAISTHAPPRTIFTTQRRFEGKLLVRMDIQTPFREDRFPRMPIIIYPYTPLEPDESNIWLL
jgi:hypothetical protein